MLPENTMALVEWSIASEPGDEFGGLLREVFGPEHSMRLVKAANSDQIRRELANSGNIDSTVYRFGDPSKTISDSLERWVPRLKQDTATAAIHSLTSQRFSLVKPQDLEWPQGFNDLGWGAPAALWVAGNADALSHAQKSVAIVGSRTATSYGQWVTHEFVSGLSEQGFCIVSGGAYGIDAIAHQAAMAMHSPTLAIMAGGVDRLYPSGNQDLLGQIAENWAVISELPPGSSPTKWRFLQRNRLIAAMSQATLVVEAGWRSGSINTANHASSLGRPVGAVPGAVTSPASAGCHRLIRENTASLVTSIPDVIDLIFGPGYLLDIPEPSTLGPLEKRAFDALANQWRTLERIASTAGLTQGEAKLALTSLELDSLVEASFQGWRRRGSNL